MPKPIQITIPTPCHENWQNMTPNDKGRHCMSCQKTVVDFTNMSDRQILQYISNAKSNVCGRASADQLNKNLVIPGNKKRFSWAYIWNIAFASFLVAGKANAQTDFKVKSDTVVEKRWDRYTYGMVALAIRDSIKGIVADAITKKPIPGAKINFSGSKWGVSSDNAGNFMLNYFERVQSNKIKVSAPGYKPLTQVVNDNSHGPITIYLQPNRRKAAEDRELFSLGEVVVVGKIMPRLQVTTTGQIIRNVVDTVMAPFKKDVKVFPNPVSRGSSINLSLSLKDAGEYKMELMDVDGRVVLIQSLTMSAQQQTAQLETNPSWSTGTYWLRISGINNKSVYQGKVLIQ